MTTLTSQTLLDPAIMAEPYDFYRTLHEQAPVWQVPGTDIYVVSSYELVVECVSRIPDFSSVMNSLLYRGDDGVPARLSFGEGGMPTLATADPPQHTAHRKAVFPQLVAQRMQELEADIKVLAAETVKTAIQDDSFDFMTQVANIIPITVISKLIGFRDSNLPQLLQAAFDSTNILSGGITLAELTDLVAKTAEVSAWIQQQILGTSSADEHDTILVAISQALAEGTLALEEATVILQTLLSAGGESTTSLIGNSVRILAEQPELQARIREHPEDLDRFIEEAVRLESPFSYLMRAAPQDTTLGGVDIPAGALLLVFWGAANRDEKEFPDAASVSFERPAPRRHMAFGRGTHYCVGAPLARIEAGSVLRAMLAQTSDFTLDPAKPPQWVDSLMIRRQAHLTLNVTPS